MVRWVKERYMETEEERATRLRKVRVIPIVIPH